jgi:hypothetical protein
MKSTDICRVLLNGTTVSVEYTDGTVVTTEFGTKDKANRAIETLTNNLLKKLVVS